MVVIYGSWIQLSPDEVAKISRSSPGLPHCRWILYQLSHQGSPRILKWVTSSFSSRSSQPRNRTRISCIAGRFFTNWATREDPRVHNGDQWSLFMLAASMKIWWMVLFMDHNFILVQIGNDTKVQDYVLNIVKKMSVFPQYLKLFFKVIFCDSKKKMLLSNDFIMTATIFIYFHGRIFLSISIF